mmetsp:Transcript_7454/g.17820  ORF Transcript_7454/g.17820 Transcript_7454/m.17820 type:complete len:393 (-) Transcript_7454:5-1183(-)
MLRHGECRRRWFLGVLESSVNLQSCSPSRATSKQRGEHAGPPHLRRLALFWHRAGSHCLRRRLGITVKANYNCCDVVRHLAISGDLPPLAGNSCDFARCGLGIVNSASDLDSLLGGHMIPNTIRSKYEYLIPAVQLSLDDLRLRADIRVEPQVAEGARHRQAAHALLVHDTFWTCAYPSHAATLDDRDGHLIYSPASSQDSLALVWTSRFLVIGKVNSRHGLPRRRAASTQHSSRVPYIRNYQTIAVLVSCNGRRPRQLCLMTMLFLNLFLGVSERGLYRRHGLGMEICIAEEALAESLFCKMGHALSLISVSVEDTHEAFGPIFAARGHESILVLISLAKIGHAPGSHDGLWARNISFGTQRSRCCGWTWSWAMAAFSMEHGRSILYERKF